MTSKDIKTKVISIISNLSVSIDNSGQAVFSVKGYARPFNEAEVGAYLRQRLKAKSVLRDDWIRKAIKLKRDLINHNDAPKIYHRIARRADAICIQVSPDQLQRIAVTEGAVKLVRKASKPIFTTPTDVLPYPSDLPAPEPEKLIPTIQDFFRLSDSDSLLIVAWMVTALMADRGYPILSLVAPAGRGKSFIAESLSLILDPKEQLIQGAQTAEALVTLASNHFVLSVDNVSKIRQDLANLLCQIATGGAHTSRKKYTNAALHQVQLSNPVILTSIDAVVLQPDLCDRTILIRPKHKKDSRNLPHAQLAKKFLERLPTLFSTLLWLCQQALAMRKRKYDKLERMANFGRYGRIVEAALELPKNSFKSAYRNNRKQQAEHIVRGSTLARGLMALLEEDKVWEGHTEELLVDLQRCIPGKLTHNHMTVSSIADVDRDLSSLIPELRYIGVKVKQKAQHNMWYSIKKIPRRLQ